MLQQFAGCALALFAVSSTTFAEVFEFTDKAPWQGATGGYSINTIPFTGFPGGTIIINQYATLGVTFTDGNDIITHSVEGFPNDSWGMRGGMGLGEESITLQCTSPQYTIATDHPGHVRFELYQGASLIASSSDLGGVGFGFFSGIISTEPFDRVRIRNMSTGVVFIDDLHFGVPAPGSLALLALAALWPRPRRRRRPD